MMLVYKAVDFPAWHRTACVIYQLNQGINVLITVLWWTLVYVMLHFQDPDHPIPPIDWHNRETVETVLFLCYVHFMPIVITFSVFLTTDIRLVKQDWWTMIPLGYAYAFWNYMG